MESDNKPPACSFGFIRARPIQPRSFILVFHPSSPPFPFILTSCDTYGPSVPTVLDGPHHTSIMAYLIPYLGVSGVSIATVVGLYLVLTGTSESTPCPKMNLASAWLGSTLTLLRSRRGVQHWQIPGTVESLYVGSARNRTLYWTECCRCRMVSWAQAAVSVVASTVGHPGEGARSTARDSEVAQHCPSPAV